MAPRDINRSLPFAMTADQLPKYGATDPSQTVGAWIERVSEDAAVYGWSEEETLLAAKRALIDTARRWLDSQRGIGSWSILKAELMEAFGRNIFSGDVHQLLRERKKKRSESLLSYIHEMEYLGAQGNLSSKEIRNYIARGVTDNLQVRVVLQAAISKEHFFGLLEAHDREMKDTVVEKARTAYGQHTTQHSKQQGRVCYECRQPGYVARECPKRNQSSELQGRCFKCKEQGHRLNNCLRDKQPKSYKYSGTPKVERVGDEGVNRSRL